MTSISIEIDEYGDDQMNGVDVGATQDVFVEKVEQAVRASYPGAQVQIDRVCNGRGCRAWFNGEEASEYGDADARAAQDIMDAIDRISENIADWAIAA